MPFEAAEVKGGFPPIRRGDTWAMLNPKEAAREEATRAVERLRLLESELKISPWLVDELLEPTTRERLNAISEEFDRASGDD